MSTIYILWLRQLKKYSRSRARVIAQLAQPLLFLVAFGFGFGPVFQRAGNGDYIQYLASGIIAQSILFTAAFTGAELIWDKQIGFLKETLVAPVPRWQIMLGRTLGGATVSCIQGIMAFLLTLLVGFRPTSIVMLPAGLLFSFMIALFFTALGTAIGSVVNDIQGFQLTMNFLIMPIFFLSGALFPLDGLPAGLKVVTNFNPLAYGIDGIRGVLVNTSHFGVPTDYLVLGLATLAVFGIGNYLFRKIQI
jgi:ABC-2 type transport system permease protein